MKNNKFTPGPWQLHRGFSDWGMPCQHDVFVGTDDNPEQIAGIPSLTPHCMGASAKDRDLASRHWADANLIAAAPEMYEASLSTVSRLLVLPRFLHSNGHAALALIVEEELEAHRAALAKADGRTQ